MKCEPENSRRGEALRSTLSVLFNPTTYRKPRFRHGPDGAPCASRTAPGGWDHARDPSYRPPTAFSIDIHFTRHTDTTNMAKITKHTETRLKLTEKCSRATVRTRARYTHRAARPLTVLASAHPGHAVLPRRSNRAHRQPPPPEAAPGHRGAPHAEKLPRDLGGKFLRTRATAGM
jgi:hypothetical protein